MAATETKEMSPAARELLVVKTAVAAPLDPGFAPLVFGFRKYVKAVEDSGSPEELHLALERPGGIVSRVKLPVFPDDHLQVEASLHYVRLMVRTYLWQRGAFKLTVSGPPKQCDELKKALSPDGACAFDAKQMTQACGCDEPFEVVIVKDPEELPASKEEQVKCGRVADGSRIAFDLGKSDMKAVAVKDGEVIYSSETEWDVSNPDPDYHYGVILKAMKDAATKLEQVDAVGGSMCGIVSPNNEATNCDLFPNVPPDVYKEKVVDIIIRLVKNEFGGVPLKVINDGEVTAVAGQMMVGEGALYGISLGSNCGCGFVDLDGNLPGWINEMYATPLDLNPEAPTNPWTPFRGDIPMYLGQRAVTRLVSLAKIEVPAEMAPDHPNMNSMNHVPHAQCLKIVQAAMKDPQTEPQARLIYETIGVYLGYAIANFTEVYKPYDMKHVLILGRVTSGPGGQVILDKAQTVLEKEFPELAHIKFHTPDERMKRVGQCVAAAALPALKRQRTS